MPETDPLEPYRQKIDAVDEKLLLLLNDRARIVEEIAKIKRDKNADFYVPSREQAIYKRLFQLNAGPFSDKAILHIFQEIISASLSLEEPVKVAYLGPRATFTHLASINRFGSSIVDFPFNSMKGVFDAVNKGRVNYGVVPVESSTEGVVSHTLDLLADSPLKIFGEIFLEVKHHLLSRAKRVEEIQQVYSHPQAIGQCKHYLEEHLPNLPLVEVSSTARAAELCQKDDSAAAIASELASKVYQVPILEKRIEDNRENITRFLVISQRDHAPTGADKTSIVISIKDTPGALYKILRHFSDQQINLSKIESRPSKKKAWEYLFHMDLIGHVEDPSIQMVLDKLRSEMIHLKVLGSYPVAEAVQR